MTYYICTAPTLRILKEKNSRPDISTLTAYEITPTTILKHIFHETKYEKVYITLKVTQPAITCSKLTIETLEQGVKYVQS